MKTGIGFDFTCQFCGALGILHEDHRAHGGDSGAPYAFRGAVGRLAISSPIVGVENELSRAFGLAVQTGGCNRRGFAMRQSGARSGCLRAVRVGEWFDLARHGLDAPRSQAVSGRGRGIVRSTFAPGQLVENFLESGDGNFVSSQKTEKIIDGLRVG